jgi:hypothetical protein
MPTRPSSSWNAFVMLGSASRSSSGSSRVPTNVSFSDPGDQLSFDGSVNRMSVLLMITFTEMIC